MDKKKKHIKTKQTKIPVQNNNSIQEHGVFYIIGENIEKFCQKYNLKVKKIKCESCGTELEMNIPSYCDGHACLEAPICKCGFKTNKIVFQPATKERKKFWSQIEKDIFSN